MFPAFLRNNNEAVISLLDMWILIKLTDIFNLKLFRIVINITIFMYLFYLL